MSHSEKWPDPAPGITAVDPAWLSAEAPGIPAPASARVAAVLVVDDSAINRVLMSDALRRAGMRVLQAARAAEALELLANEEIDLIILDTMMPEMDGMECCRHIRASRRTELIPVLMVGCMEDLQSEVAGIGAGADEYLARPFHPDLLCMRARALLRRKAIVDRMEESEALLFTLAQAVELRDSCTGEHCRRMARNSVKLGASAGLGRPELLALHRGGFLHDVGKIAVPDAVLNKPGALDKHEWEVMRSHTWKGEEICRPMKCLGPVLPIVRHHHERWDGSGYPDGLRGQNIPLLARILQMSDIYDALTTPRPYKRAFTSKEALDIMRDETRRGWRDPELMHLFAEIQEHGMEESLDRMSSFLSSS